MISKSEIVRQLASNIDVEQLADNNLHIAVMRNPYLRFVLDGSKTVESRLSKTRIDPYKKAITGDFILFKQSGGPIVAIAKIVNCWYYENLDYTDILWLKAKFNSLVLGSDDYWKKKHSAKYASFFQLSAVTKIQPIIIHKSDGRAWVVL
ncbi:ASCH domain-containing protein [Dapis sp. BLCC M229]|uniref:ASCH domain-containing protein n=1 Tax=Dapis sp. BLCC M229 TaxID=3400188 RepID=UPI003CF6FCF9